MKLNHESTKICIHDSRHVIHRSEPAIMQRCYLLTSLRACRSTKQIYFHKILHTNTIYNTDNNMAQKQLKGLSTKSRHVAYRQLVRWCWSVLGKEIRVPLPFFVISCIRAHFPPPGLEEDFGFEGFNSNLLMSKIS